MAQRLLVLKQDKSVVPALQQMVRSSDNLLAQIPRDVDARGARRARCRSRARRDEGQEPAHAQCRRSAPARRSTRPATSRSPTTTGRSPRIRTRTSSSRRCCRRVSSSCPTWPIWSRRHRPRTPPKVWRSSVSACSRRHRPPSAAAVAARRSRPDEEKRLQQGSDVFGAVCFACHGADGMGAPLEGAPPGTMMAPPLAGSPRVQAHRDYVIKVLLEGADRSARRQDLPRRDGADGRHRRVDRRNRVVRPQQLRQQRRSGDACRRRASPRRDGVSHDSVDGARARRLAAASARFAAVEADRESRAPRRPSVARRCAAGPPACRRRRACGSRSSCRSRQWSPSCSSTR